MHFTYCLFLYNLFIAMDKTLLCPLIYSDVDTNTNNNQFTNKNKCYKICI